MRNVSSPRTWLVIHVRYVPYEDECERLLAKLGKDAEIAVMCPDGNKVTGRPELISKDPEIAVRGSSLILLPLPANICSLMLSEICHFLDDDACVGALPGQGGFQWSADQIFRDCSRLHGRPDWYDRGIKIFGLEASLIPFAPFATPHFVMCLPHPILSCVIAIFSSISRAEAPVQLPAA